VFSVEFVSLFLLVTDGCAGTQLLCESDCRYCVAMDNVSVVMVSLSEWVWDQLDVKCCMTI
jgi:hypothetical protein